MIFKRRHITPYFVGSLICLAAMLGNFVYSFLCAGNVPFKLALFDMGLMVVTLILTVLGRMEMPFWKEEKRTLGIAGARIYTLVFLGMLGFYMAGLYLA